MKTETLQGIGLNDEQIRSVMAEFGNEINPLKQSKATTEQERDSLKTQLDEVNGQLKEAQRKQKREAIYKTSSRTYKRNMMNQKPMLTSNCKQLRRITKFQQH